ncbi:LamB/YcsF family protein [Specibacter cremeus]|uniref:LamB/YcsF family protein n=1 Tax=Specibacter cremeus TaxID=1629051 RepID=UPI000F779550|nr:5-oxoprolinase subunit PxpA [Specibacter cremeus]
MQLDSNNRNTIDLNSDVGESFGPWTFGDDARIMASVTSVNVACGFHAGDPSTIRATCAAAARGGLAVGAHPGYRDLAGFGRRFIDCDPAGLTDDLVYQIGALQALARAEGTAVTHVKPHGALYNAIVHHEPQARAVAAAVLAVDPRLPLVVLPGSVIERVAHEAGLATVGEAFADRAYNPDGTLVARGTPGAVLTDVRAVVDQALRLAVRRQVTARDGSAVDVDARSICVHGDTPGAVAMAAAVRAALDGAGVTVARFA